MTLIWATRGRSWGVRFLLDGGYEDPLPAYEGAFAGTQGESELCRRVSGGVALRLLDPLHRKDAAGRVIPHDFVISEPLAHLVGSIEDGVREVWPLVADIYGQAWDSSEPPRPQLIQAAFRSARIPRA